MTRPATIHELNDGAAEAAETAPVIDIHPPIVKALALVAGEVREVGKTGRNESQNFSFRGIDAVVNAVGPAFRKFGVVCLPMVEDYRCEPMPLSNNRQATRVVVTVRYRFHGPAGDHLDAVAVGEAFDMGDKATAKAMSVAYRTCLLQALTIPTDDPDPDEHSYEQAPAAAPVPGFRASLIAAKDALNETERGLLREWLAEQGLPGRPSEMNQEQAERVCDYILHGLPKIDPADAGGDPPKDQDATDG